MRTKQEIATEIAALQNLNPTGAFRHATKMKIGLAIEELDHGVDDTADEWNELDPSEQDIVLTTRRWKDGDSNEKPSEGWGALVS